MAKLLLEGLRGCVDCLHFAANGTVPQDRPNIAAEIEKATGYPASCLVPSGNQREQRSFSHRQCETCGSRLGGDRFTFACIGQGKEAESRKVRLLPGGKPKWIRCYDNGGESADRYTIVYTRQSHDRWFNYRAMSESPFHPQGVGLFCQTQYNPPDRPTSGHLGKRIKFDSLPDDCRKLVLRDYKELWDL